MRNRIIAALAAALVLFAFAVGSQERSQSLAPRALIVFKNGLSWIEHRGSVTLSDGWGSLSTPPEAVLGTLSVAAEKGRVDEVRTSGGSSSTETMATLLKRAEGKTVTLRIGDRETSGRLKTSDSSEFVLLESGGKTTAVPRGLITTVMVDGSMAMDPGEARALRFHLADAAAQAPVRVSYLRPGIGWFPDYSILLDGDGHADLTMRATLVNDGEDLRDTDVFFAVGVPNFAFGQIESPLSGRNSLAELFQALGRASYETLSVMANSTVNIASQSMSPNTTRGGWAVDGMTTEGTEGESADDFFFYSRKQVTLAKGERAAFPLVEASVKYSDIYTLDIPRESQSDPYSGRSAEPPLADKVWHSVRLTNPTKLPWTTAPALVFLGGKPVAQETLRYTPALGETKLRLTVANSIIASRSESELTRQKEAVRRFGSAWDIVTVEGTIDVRNFKDEPITLAVSREIEGEAVASQGLEVSRVVTQPRAMNPMQSLQWEVRLGGGEKRSIRYQYKVYVRG